MKQIQADSVGSAWRADVMNAAQYAPVEVIDLDGARLGVVEFRADSKGRKYLYINSRRSSNENLWQTMHNWADIIAKQNARDYRVRMGSAE